MNDGNADIQESLDALAADGLDALSPRQVARLEARLNTDAELAARIADRSPMVEPSFRVGGEPPPAEAWEQVWQRINAAAASRHTAGWRTLRLWRPLAAAAAACVLMVGLWSVGRGAKAQPWPVEWAHDVEINELEVLDGRMPFVLAGGANAVPVIWVLENGG